MDYKCKVCKVSLDYEAELGAPGKGHSYVCPKCKTKYWVYGSSCISFKEMAIEDLTLDIHDVI